MVADASKLDGNAKILLKNFPEAKRILKKADGKKDYKTISIELKINEKIVSPALSYARDLGFAKRIKPGVYKKIVSNMKYIPNPKIKTKEVLTIEKVISKHSKKRKNVSPSKKVVKFEYENRVEKMTLAYEWLFITENILRDLVREVVGKENNWWENRIPEGVKKSVREAIQNSRYDDAPRKDNLEYTHIGQLKEIILWRKNWEKFKPFLKSTDRNNFEVEINRVIPSRNAIGHCIPLVGDEYRNADMRFKAILKLLK